jgi:hypothetical protein
VPNPTTTKKKTRNPTKGEIREWIGAAESNAIEAAKVMSSAVAENVSTQLQSRATIQQVVDIVDLKIRDISNPTIPTIYRTLRILLLIVAARSLLFLALAGACVLAALCMGSPDRDHLLALGLYAVGVLWPLVLLYARIGLGGSRDGRTE